MDFKISMVKGQPVWDALPVGKIIYYPLEKRDYRPFAQVRMCVNETDFFLRLWAFETRPSPESVLMARLAFAPDQKEPYLQIRVDSFGGMDCTVQDGEKKTPLALYGVLPQLHSYRGEDLEGEYWGVVVTLPRSAVQKIYGTDPIAPGYAMRGNLYKEDTAPKSSHRGSLFPIDLEQEDPFGPASFQPFVFVNY
ncbi:MAG: hypothetical protein PHE47_05150 [Oscillospiraceae bacterium]|nr:hypothetical protein [Oscillospiraceae bacterium]